MQVFRATLTSHDFLFFVSRELKVGVASDVINNTAILYAVNTFTPAVHRNASGSRPHYPEDRLRFAVYATPADLSSSEELVIGTSHLKFTHPASPIKITYNSVDSTYIVSMETSAFHQKEKKLAYPKVGSYYKYPPLTSFHFFTVNGTGPRVIRLGKKMPPAVVHYEPIDDVRTLTGEFQPDHPVQIAELPKVTVLLAASMVMLPNGVIARRAKLKGPYIEGRCNGERQVIAMPEQTLYPNVTFK